MCKSHREILETGRIRLFKSHRSDYMDGEQKRDFVYIKDVVEIMWRLLNNRRINGIYNLGTGQAHSWNQLAMAMFGALGKEPKIDYFDMPESIRNQYQYFTEASMDKLAAVLPGLKFRSLQDSVAEYVVDYLNDGRYLG
ncbi:NAD-dependent epimerase/dehydratase family protein [bacterium]|nr:NAD-dependent epimerase/dehydratase family protein [bacterium]